MENPWDPAGLVSLVFNPWLQYDCPWKTILMLAWAFWWKVKDNSYAANVSISFLGKSATLVSRHCCVNLPASLMLMRPPCCNLHKFHIHVIGQPLRINHCIVSRHRTQDTSKAHLFQVSEDKLPGHMSVGSHSRPENKKMIWGTNPRLHN